MLCKKYSKIYPRVVFIAGTLRQGGAERQLYYILKVMKEAGAQPLVLSLTSGEYWESKIRDLGVTIKWIGRFKQRTARLASLISVLRQYRPEVIQSTHFFVNLYAVAASRLFNSYEIGAIRSNVFKEIKNTGILGLLSLRLPRKLAVNSNQAISNANALEVQRNRLFFLPNAIDSKIFQLKRNVSKNQIKILLIGSLTEPKRIDRFLSIFAQVLSRLSNHIDVRGSIIGSGPLKKELVGYAKNLRLFPNHVVFQESCEDVLAAYQSSDIFVLTSAYEGTPNVILEAMACGLPVVAFRVGGIPEILRNEDTGFLVDQEDEESMVKIITTLAIDKALRDRIGRRAREYVVNVHSLEKLNENLHKLYNEVMHNHTI